MPGVIVWIIEFLAHNAVAIGAATAIVTAVPTVIEKSEEAYLKAKEIERVHAEEKAKEEGNK